MQKLSDKLLRRRLRIILILCLKLGFTVPFFPGGMIRVSDPSGFYLEIQVGNQPHQSERLLPRDRK